MQVVQVEYIREWLLNFEADIVAININDQMIELTKQRIKNRGKVYQADLNQPLEFLNNYFDLVVSSLTLHYLQNWSRIFQ